MKAALGLSWSMLSYHFLAWTLVPATRNHEPYKGGVLETEGGNGGKRFPGGILP